MNLIFKVGIFAVIVAVAMILVYSGAVSKLFKQAPISKLEAQAIVIKDLNKSYPTANISIINVSPSSSQNSSWNFVVKMVYNKTKPCPTLLIIEYNYPAAGLVPSLYNLYTDKCIINGTSNSTNNKYYSYIISTPEIATVRAYDLSTALKNYVYTFGYNETNASAEYYKILQNSSTPLNKTMNNVWLIKFDANDATYSEYAVLNQNGTISGEFSLQK